MNIERITMKDALDLLSLPRTIGADPTDGELITAQNGKFGPYISKGKDSRSLPGEEELLTVTLEEALALLATPRVFGKGRAAAKPPLKEFGNDPMSGRPVIGKEGKFGDYITDGETNAGLTRGDRMEVMTNERAYELLQLRREYIEANGGPKKKPKGGSSGVKAKPKPKKPSGSGGTAAKKAPAKKKAAAKKAPAKKKTAAAQPISKDEPF